MKIGHSKLYNTKKLFPNGGNAYFKFSCDFELDFDMSPHWAGGYDWWLKLTFLNGRKWGDVTTLCFCAGKMLKRKSKISAFQNTKNY